MMIGAQFTPLAVTVMRAHGAARRAWPRGEASLADARSMRAPPW